MSKECRYPNDETASFRALSFIINSTFVGWHAQSNAMGVVNAGQTLNVKQDSTSSPRRVPLALPVSFRFFSNDRSEKCWQPLPNPDMLSNMMRSQPHTKTVKHYHLFDELCHAAGSVSSCLNYVRKHWRSQWHPAQRLDAPYETFPSGAQ